MTYEKFRGLRKAILLLSIFSISLAPGPQRRLGMIDFSSRGINAEHKEALKALREEEKRVRKDMEKVENREFEAIQNRYDRYMAKFLFIIKYEKEQRSKIEQICQAEMRTKIGKFSEECKSLEGMEPRAQYLRGLFFEKVKEKLGELYKRAEHNNMINILDKRIDMIIERELDSEYFLDFPEEDPDSYSHAIRQAAETNASVLKGTILGNIIDRINNPEATLSPEAKIYIQELKKAIDAANSARLRHRILICGAYGEYYKIFLNE